VPEDDVVVRLLHARVAGVVVHVDVVDLRPFGGLEIVERLARLELRDRHHVHRAHEFAVAVVGQERAGGQRRGIDVEHADSGQELGQRHQVADLLVALIKARRRRVI
jgi:hypothetical protein